MLSVSGGQHVWPGLFVVLLLQLGLGRRCCRSALQMLKRLRWFFLSLIILYFWATPGEPLWPVGDGLLAPWWMPTREGLAGGAVRIAALCAIILAVSALLNTLSRTELLQAIHGLLRPFRHLGLSTTTVALRIVLVFEAMAEVQTVVVRCLAARERQRKVSLEQLGDLAGTIFFAVLAEAERRPRQALSLPAYPPPPPWQWSLPGTLLIGWLASV